MGDTIIKVENLSKCFTISHEARERYTSLRDVLANTVRNTLSRSKKGSRSTVEEFWALKDISFEIKKGERIGIIGRNGAGKSTLLKILSRITEPSKGRVTIDGKVASLLEVGTGFHPELTGRENIFLNGAILGMSRFEIRKKFDEIVAFSEVEQFLDTPVKRYSSGMYVRLAFAVAAHMEPEILIIDEVLAVGDAQFQKKCLGKMEDVSKNEGRTILLVSHSMTTVQSLATRSMFLLKGESMGIEDVYSGVQKYLYGGVHDNLSHFKPSVLNIKADAYIIEGRLLNSNGDPVMNFLTYEPVTIEVTWVNKGGDNVTPNLMLVNQQGVTVMVASDTPIDFYGDKKKSPGTYLSKFTIPGNWLNANDYFVHLALDNHSPRVCYDSHLDCFRFTITDPMDENCIARGGFKSVREDAVLWPALICSYSKID